jgi:hypothetical protein
MRFSCLTKTGKTGSGEITRTEIPGKGNILVFAIIKDKHR